MGSEDDTKKMEQEPLTVASSAPGGRPGIRTTEFWVMVAMTLLGAWLIERDHDELGAYLIMIAGGGYTAARGVLKHKAIAVSETQGLTAGMAPPGVRMATDEEMKSILTKKQPPRRES